MLPRVSAPTEPRDPTSVLLGRADECAVLDALVADVRRGESRSLVLRGEAGIGKSALLGHAAARAAATGVRVLRADGCRAESEVPHAALGQLLLLLAHQSLHVLTSPPFFSHLILRCAICFVMIVAAENMKQSVDWGG